MTVVNLRHGMVITAPPGTRVVSIRREQIGGGGGTGAGGSIAAVSASLRAHSACAPSMQRSRWQCAECGKLLSSKRSYDEHLNIHNKSRPFTCDHCDYAAASQMTLRRHILRNHTSRDDWGYRCPYCSEAYMEPASYQQHVSSRHFGRSATFGCPYASCSFQSKCLRHFKEHLVKHHNCVSARRPVVVVGTAPSGSFAQGPSPAPTPATTVATNTLPDDNNLAQYLVDDELGVGWERRFAMSGRPVVRAGAEVATGGGPGQGKPQPSISTSTTTMVAPPSMVPRLPLPTSASSSLSAPPPPTATATATTRLFIRTGNHPSSSNAGPTMILLKETPAIRTNGTVAARMQQVQPTQQLQQKVGANEGTLKEEEGVRLARLVDEDIMKMPLSLHRSTMGPPVGRFLSGSARPTPYSRPRAQHATRPTQHLQGLRTSALHFAREEEMPKVLGGSKEAPPMLSGEDTDWIEHEEVIVDEGPVYPDGSVDFPCD